MVMELPEALVYLCQVVSLYQIPQTHSGWHTQSQSAVCRSCPQCTPTIRTVLIQHCLHNSGTLIHCILLHEFLTQFLKIITEIELHVYLEHDCRGGWNVVFSELCFGLIDWVIYVTVQVNGGIYILPMYLILPVQHSPCHLIGYKTIC